MLDSLREYSKTGALGVLSQIASSFTPESPVESEQQPEQVDFQSPTVLQEIYKRLGLKMDDYSPEAKDKVLQFVSDQIRQTVLSGTDEDKIKSRLASKRILRPDLYVISIGDADWIGGRGIRRQQIHDAINYADRIEHVPLNGMFSDDQEELSFYLQYVRGDESRRVFSLLVVASRKGYELKVIDALRVYPSDVEVANTSEPIDMLKKFVEKYGLVMTVGGAQSKFFLLARFEKPRIIGNEQPIIEGHNQNGDSFQSIMILKDEPHMHEVVMAYAVNETIYRRGLKRHGVQVKQP